MLHSWYGQLGMHGLYGVSHRTLLALLIGKLVDLAVVAYFDFAVV